MWRRTFSQPLPLLLLLTGLFTFLIQSGELGTADTSHRLQVAHSLWTGQPQVFPAEYPEFGLHGHNGHLYAWYGIGQSLLLLPADLLATAATHLPFWQDYVESQADPAIRSILVSISINILINVFTALLCYRLLSLFSFPAKESVAGTLALLLATTHLHYAQNLQENNYILLLTLTGLLLQTRWLNTGSQRALFWGSIALGLNLLTRITTALDLIAVAAFLVLLTLHRRKAVPAPSVSSLPALARSYLRIAAPVYAAFFFLDRLYQFLRFGSWTNTYVTIFAREERQIDPTLPLKYPFSGHFFAGGIDSGMLGPFFHPAKSILLFDPLFPLTLLFAAVLWRKLDALPRAFLLTTWGLILAYLLFYARYFSWPGDFAWGDRYVSSAVQLSTLLTWPLLLRHRGTLSRSLWNIALAITALSFVLQCSSLAFWVPLEIYQMETFGPHTWVIPLRFKNIAALALHRTAAWGLHTPAMFEDAWDAQHITTWNFLPSLLRHIGVAPMGAIHLLYALWLLAAAALLATAFRLFKTLRHPSMHANNQTATLLP